MPSSSFVLRSSATLISLLSIAASPVQAAYTLDTEYSGSNFFSGFNFFDSADPTHGFVTYLNQQDAHDAGLISAGGQTYIGVDYKNKYDASKPYYNINGVGRKSVRIESNKSWKYGLFVADIAHAPSGKCGTWPAFWTLGVNTWPTTGEIDIFEGANDQSTDWTSLHTGNTCSIPSSGPFSGSVEATDCNYNNGNNNGVGCKIVSSNSNSYSNFNGNGGGVYAMEWTTEFIKIWFFSHSGRVPDMTNPDTSSWGRPLSVFPADSCDIPNRFDAQKLIFDNTFCGDLGEATWGYASNGGSATGCAARNSQYSSCAAFVADQPAYFQDAYWEINYVRVFQQGSATTTTTSTTAKTTSTSTWTSTSAATTWTSTTSRPYVTSTTTSGARYYNTTSATGKDSPVSTSFVWEDWTTTTKGDWDPSKKTTTTTVAWEDWSATATTTKKGDWDPSKSTSTAWADWDPSKKTTTTVEWEDWTTTTTTKKGEWDPSKSTSTAWADWDPSKKSTTTTAWDDWSVTTSSVKKAATPTDGETWADWASTVTATGIVTRTVQPVASTAVKAAGTSGAWGPSSASSTNVWAAKYTGAADKVGMSNIAMFAAAGAAGVFVAAL